jgi:hypothetical protein
VSLKKLITNNVEIKTVTGTGSAQDVTHPFRGIPSHVTITPLETGAEATMYETIASRSSSKIVFTGVSAKTYSIAIYPPSPA